jgi:predicted O-methyltransferase YrrM
VVYAIDPWSGETLTEDGQPHAVTLEVWTSFAWHLRDHLRTKRVRPIRALSATALPTLLATIGATADLVFLDGDHREDSVTADIEAAWPLVKEGGLLSGHDYGNATWPGVSRAVDARFGPGVQTVGSIWWVRR